MTTQNQTNVEPSNTSDATATSGADNTTQRDILASAFDKLVADGVEPDNETVTASSDDAEPVTDTEATEEIGDSTASLESEEGAEEADTKVSSTPSGPVTSAPTDFPKIIKEKWDTIDPEVQNAMIARDRQQRARFSEQGVELQRVTPIADKLDALSEQYPQFKGVTSDQMVERVAQLASVQAHLDANPLQGVLDIARAYGVVGYLQQAFSGRQPDNDKNTILHLQQQVANLNRQLQGQQPGQSPTDIDNIVDTKLNLRAVEDVINDFTVQHGLSAEEFNELEPFVTLVRRLEPDAGAEEVLQKAYDMAVNALPSMSVRANVGNATTGDVSANTPAGGPSTTATPNSKRTVKAAKAAALNVKSTAANKPVTKTQRQAMGEAWDRMHS